MCIECKVYHPVTGAVRCCVNFSPNPLPLNRLKDFTIQDATTVCRLHAVIFTTVKERKICADPDSTWVKNAVNYISKFIIILMYKSISQLRKQRKTCITNRMKNEK
ncbi:C-C motif chemokine 20 [Pangasianodon hypophthalmus]|uniref:C-C motif chemokine 20 n=1 Tax=Pangasianodon hypophthalmus TaxID=310915 RepID=UPI002307EDEA|nr:C-C motif chemokine 20 [Pangasianodon hypophthalmus]